MSPMAFSPEAIWRANKIAAVLEGNGKSPADIDSQVGLPDGTTMSMMFLGYAPSWDEFSVQYQRMARALGLNLNDLKYKQ